MIIIIQRTAAKKGKKNKFFQCQRWWVVGEKALMGKETVEVPWVQVVKTVVAAVAAVALLVPPPPKTTTRMATKIAA